MFRTQNHPGEAVGTYSEVGESLCKLITSYQFQMGVVNGSEPALGWHTRYLMVVRLVKAIHIIKAEKRSIYTKVPTKMNFKGSRDERKVIYLDPLRSRPGNFVVFFLH